MLLLLLWSFFSIAQKQSFNDIHKLVEAKKFKEAIPQLKKFVESDGKHISAHYDLANCYSGILVEIASIQNANVNNQKTELWTDKEYQENLNFWKNGINVTDSAIYFYKQTSELMNIKFLTLDLRYNEFYLATKDCGILEKVKCARNYLAKIIEGLEKTNVSNKSRLFNEEKNYEAFKKKSQPNYTGTYKYSIGEGQGAGGGIDGELAILQTDNQIKFSVSVARAGGNIMNGGVTNVDGEIILKDNIAVYDSKSENGHCKFKIGFSTGKATIEYLENASACGSGDIGIALEYKKINSKTPTF